MSAMKKYAPPYDIAVILKEDCKSFITRDDSIKLRISTEEWGDVYSSGKQDNDTLYINYHKWTRNIKNITYYYHRTFTGFQKNMVRKWGHFFKDTGILKKYRGIGCVKEKQLEIDISLII